MIKQMKLIQLNLTATFLLLELISECFYVRGLSVTSHLLAFLQSIFLPKFNNTNIKSITWDVWAKKA
jgi:hypothetical protein